MYCPSDRLSAGGSRRHADRRQILEPALRLHEPLTFGDIARGLRSCATKISAASSLIISCSLVSSARRFAVSNSPRMLSISLSIVGVAVMAPIGALGRPGAGPDVADQRVERVLRGAADIDRVDVGAGVDAAARRPAAARSSPSTCSVTSNPAASSCDLTSSFIGSGCICPEPEVEIANVTLHGRQPASFSSALALSGSYL